MAAQLKLAKAFIGHSLRFWRKSASSSSKISLLNCKPKGQREVTALQNFLFSILAVDYSMQRDFNVRIDPQDSLRYRSFCQNWSTLKAAILNDKETQRDLVRAHKQLTKLVYRPALALGLDPANVITRLVNYDAIVSHYGGYQSCHEVYNKVLGVVARDSLVRTDRTWVEKIAPDVKSAGRLADAVEDQLDECSATSEVELRMTPFHRSFNSVLVDLLVGDEATGPLFQDTEEMCMDHYGRELRRWISTDPFPL